VTPFESCPRYSSCSANVCPLDPDQDKRAFLPGESRCGVARTIRVRIAAAYPTLLPRGGLTLREHAAARTWAAMPASQREATLARLAAHPLPPRRGSAGQTPNIDVPKDAA